MATLMNCGVCLCDCFQGIGFSQNYYEVGGPDTAILTSVGNVFASLGGWVRGPARACQSLAWWWGHARCAAGGAGAGRLAAATNGAVVPALLDLSLHSLAGGSRFLCLRLRHTGAAGPALEA